jgi:hypothetical protein
MLEQERNQAPASAIDREIKEVGVVSDIKNFVEAYLLSHNYGKLLVNIRSVDIDAKHTSSGITLNILISDPENPSREFKQILTGYTLDDMSKIEAYLQTKLEESFPTLH